MYPMDEEKNYIEHSTYGSKVKQNRRKRVFTGELIVLLGRVNARKISKRKQRETGSHEREDVKTLSMVKKGWVEWV